MVDPATDENTDDNTDAGYDVAIVGGGPIGLAAAIEARLAGLTTVVIEQRDGTIDKACGEGLMPGALPILARLGVDPAGMPIAGITYLQGTRSVTHRFAQRQGRGVRRLVLHAALNDRADALGVRRITAKVDAVSQSADSVTVAGITARYLLACDGLHSTVARLAGLTASGQRPTADQAKRPVIARQDRATQGDKDRPTQRDNNRPTHRRYGIRQHFAVAPWSDTVEVYYASKAEVYVTPIAAGEVGIAILGPSGTDFDEVIASIPSLTARLAGATPASERRGAGPFKTRTTSRTAGRILLVGDASGYVDAITGEGLRLGFAQAQAAVAAIKLDDPARYEREWKRITRDFRVTTTMLVRAATSPLRRAIVPLSVALPGRFGAVVESLAR
jgi:flavin-dependent dehydrogenase